jgi:HEAT repeat protein
MLETRLAPSRTRPQVSLRLGPPTTPGVEGSPMKRLLASAVLVAAGFVALAGDLWAHGGQFRGPGGSVPPSMREPTDPTPPPPPPPPSGVPPTTPPPTTPGAGPTPPPPPTTPQPTTPPPTTGDLGSGPGAGKKSPLSYESWLFWYENNKEDIERLKDMIYSRMTTENPLGQLGGQREAGGQASGATQATATKVKSDIIPAMIWAMDPKHAGHQDVESAAYIALAKITADPQHIEKITNGLSLEQGKKRDQITMESAALALGLLRRADPAKQFAATELDKVRTTLFEAIENEKHGTGTRAFAAMALGLLGDQPTGSGDYAGDVDAARKATTARLWDLAQRKWTDENIPVALLLGMGLQPKNSVTEDMQAKLAECTLKGKLGSTEVSDLVRSYAALQLGRVGSPASIPPLKTALTARTVDKQTQRSVAIALGLLGRLVPVDSRLELAKVLKEGVEKNSDNSVRNFGLISLAYLVNKDIEEGRTDVVEQAKVGEYLLQQAKDGNFMQRPFGALALGLVGRRIDDTNTIKFYEEFKQNALLALREGLESQKMDKRSRAGFATALGIIKDSVSRKNLVKLVGDDKEDKELRGYSAIALGLIGQLSEDVKKALYTALGERSSEDMRQQMATALGLLQDPGAVNELLKALKDAESQNLKGQIVLALAKIGDARAVEPMVKMLQDTKEGDLTRALACAGLGVVGDLESLPSLARMSKDINYRSSIFYVNEYLSIL